MWLPLFATLFVICTALFAFFKYRFSYWRSKGVPQLNPTVPFGNASSFFLNRVCIGEMFQRWYLAVRSKGWAFGGFYFGTKPVFIAAANDLIKRIIVTDFIHFPNHGMHIDVATDPLSGHIFNLENYKWKSLRTRLPVAFTAAKMRRNVLVMERLSRALLERLESRHDRSLNIKDTVSRFTMDVISACGLGIETETLRDKNPRLFNESREFFDHQWSRKSNTLVLLVPRAMLRLCRFRLFPERTTEFFMGLFKSVKEQRQRERNKRNDLTDLLMELCNETKTHVDFNGTQIDPLSFDEFAAQLYVFFEAGFETSSSTQTFALYELAANQDVQDRLRQEIEEVLERHDGKIGYDSINDMSFLDRVVDETLRKYPVFPVLARECTKDYQIPETDVKLAKGTFVMVTNLGIHYDPEYYPEPMRFDPDRFLPENKAKRPYCSYMPFGEGPRICLGKRFGIWQTKIGLLTIIRNYRVTLSRKMRLPFSFDTAGLILKAKGDVWIDLQKI